MTCAITVTTLTSNLWFPTIGLPHCQLHTTHTTHINGTPYDLNQPGNLRNKHCRTKYPVSKGCSLKSQIRLEQPSRSFICKLHPKVCWGNVSCHSRQLNTLQVDCVYFEAKCMSFSFRGLAFGARYDVVFRVDISSTNQPVAGTCPTTWLPRGLQPNNQ